MHNCTRPPFDVVFIAFLWDDFFFFLRILFGLNKLQNIVARTGSVCRIWVAWKNSDHFFSREFMWIAFYRLEAKGADDRKTKLKRWN